MVADKLNGLKDQFDACQVIAFADLSAQMIFVTDGTNTLSRDALNALCKEADLLLGKAENPMLGQATCSSAIRKLDDKVKVFLRSTEELNEGLCCVLTADAKIEPFLTEAQKVLDDICSSGTSQ